MNMEFMACGNMCMKCVCTILSTEGKLIQLTFDTGFSGCSGDMTCASNNFLSLFFHLCLIILNDNLTPHSPTKSFIYKISVQIRSK